MKKTLGNKWLLYIYCILNFCSPLLGRNSLGFRSLIQLLLKVEVQILWEVLVTFFSLLRRPFVPFIQMQESDPSFLSIFSFSIPSCVGQGQNKGQSNSLNLLQLCRLKVVGNTLFLSVTKELCYVRPLSNPLKEKVEYVSPWCKMSRLNDSNLPV